ncbi:MAG: phosphatidylinositol-specific phospholipase C domain-containing protein [Cyanobacteria bacterium P01_F01_bin.150]
MSIDPNILDEWIHILNGSHGLLFAADNDKYGEYHVVETNPDFQEEEVSFSIDKYLWRIHDDNGDFLIENRKYGYMMAAQGDKKGSNHIVECYHQGKSISDISKLPDKWKWKIDQNGRKVVFTNVKYGNMLAADNDKISWAHIVECNPKSSSTTGKFEWSILKGGYSKHSWMEDLGGYIKSKSLCQLAIPGTHDSATHKISRSKIIAPEQDITTNLNIVLRSAETKWTDYLDPIGLVSRKIVKTVTESTIGQVVVNWSKAQENSIYTQLHDGIRYFDLRIVKQPSSDGDKLYICHGMYSLPVEEVLKEVKDFHNSNPKEIVILDFNHFYNMDNSAHVELLIMIDKYFGDCLAGGKSLSPKSTVKEFWEPKKETVKLPNNFGASSELTIENIHSIAVVYHHDAPSGDNIRKIHEKLWRKDQIDSPWPNVQNISDLKQGLEEELSPETRTELHVVQGVLTPNTETIAVGSAMNAVLDFNRLASDLGVAAFPKSLKALAKLVNPFVTKWIIEWVFDDSKDFNIVMVDFYDDKFVDTVILVNKETRSFYSS